jgi:hypothetical protein
MLRSRSSFFRHTGLWRKVCRSLGVDSVAVRFLALQGAIFHSRIKHNRQSEATMAYDRRRLRGNHPPACNCVECEERRMRRTPFSHHPPNCPCAGCEYLREQQRLESWGNDARPESDNSQGRGPRQAAPIRNLSPRPTDQTIQRPTPPQPSKPTEAQQEQQPQRGPRQTAPIRNLSPRPSDLTSQPPKPPEVRQGGQRPTPLQPPTTAGARQRPQQSRRNPRGNNLLKLVIPAALAVAVLGCAILLLG